MYHERIHLFINNPVSFLQAHTKKYKYKNSQFYMEESLQKLMLTSHKILGSFLEKLEQQVRRNARGDAKRTFDRFEWALKKHFLIEEKAIFIFLQNEKGEKIANTFDLMQEHGHLLDILNKVKEEMTLHGIADVSKLKESLQSHSRFENEIFYPRLDEELRFEQKEEILRKIRENIKLEL